MITTTKKSSLGARKATKKDSPRYFLFFSFLALLFIFLPLVTAIDTYYGGVPSDGITLTKFIIMGVFVLFFLIVGLTSDVSYFILASMVILFIMGVIMQGGNLYVPKGTYYMYGNNFTLENGTTTYHWDYGVTPEYAKQDNVAVLYHERTEYSQWEGEYSHLFGWLIMVISTVFFALTLYGLRSDDY